MTVGQRTLRANNSWWRRSWKVWPNLIGPSLAGGTVRRDGILLYENDSCCQHKVTESVGKQQPALIDASAQSAS